MVVQLVCFDFLPCVFLLLLALVLDLDDSREEPAIVLALAAGELSEDELADWFRQHLA